MLLCAAWVVSISPLQAKARQTNDPLDKLTKRERQIVRDYEKRYLDTLKVNVRHVNGDGRIEPGEQVQGHVQVIKGTLRISGQVQGTVLALFSDVELDSAAVISGNLVCVNGKVWRKSGAMIQGDLVETHLSTSEPDKEYKNRRDRNWHPDWDLEDGMDGLYADYNRVDGLTLGLKFPQNNWWNERRKHFAVLGKIGYAFVRDHIQYRIGLERWVGHDLRFAIGGQVHDLTDTEDRWIISDTENSLAAALIRQDFRDYYRRRGFGLYATQNIGRHVQFKAEYSEDDIYNLPQLAKWSLFGGKKKFMANPAALPYDFSLITGSKTMELNPVMTYGVTIDTRDHQQDPRRGWLIQANLEQGQMGKKSFYDYSRAIVDVRRYQPLGWGENLSIRLRAGSATGLLLPMYWFDLGGLSTLRGYRFKSMTGDRMVLANLEYRVNTFGSDWFLLDDFDLVLFMDSGTAWFNQENARSVYEHWPVAENAQQPLQDQSLEDGFDSLRWKKLKTNIGLGLASRDGDFRIDFAKPTSHNGKDIVVTFRLQRSF
jgi:outer membrane protein assembly factor BamA